MAKRARGTTTRPGQRRPIQRPPIRPGTPTARPGATAPSAEVAVSQPSSLTPAEEARAAELEAAIVAVERQADEGRRNRTQGSAPVVGVRAGSSLVTAAANEYAYVARDVRRVAIVGGSLVALLLAMWAVAEATGVKV